MNDVNRGLALSLIAGAVLAQSAVADSIPVEGDIASPSELQQLQPSIDTRPVQKRILNGEVNKAERTEDNQIQEPQRETVQLNSARQLDLSDLIKAANRGGFKLVIKSSGMSFFDLKPRRPKMSSEEFRKLEYGVIGLNAVVHLDGSGPVITEVYPTCPAANAGMRPGDLIVKANDYVFKRGDGQRVLWNIVGGKADTPVDVTVLRDGELTTFHLMRMNIEDIQDNKIRGTFEDLLSQLGPPSNATRNAESQMQIEP